MSNANSPVRGHSHSHHQQKLPYVRKVHSQDSYLPKKHKESGNHCRFYHSKLLRYDWDFIQEGGICKELTQEHDTGEL